MGKWWSSPTHDVVLLWDNTIGGDYWWDFFKKRPWWGFNMWCFFKCVGDDGDDDGCACPPSWSCPTHQSQMLQSHIHCPHERCGSSHLLPSSFPRSWQQSGKDIYHTDFKRREKFELEIIFSKVIRANRRESFNSESVQVQFGQERIICIYNTELTQYFLDVPSKFLSSPHLVQRKEDSYSTCKRVRS